MKRWLSLGVVALAAVSLLWPGFVPAAFAQAKGKPIVFGYVGNVASPGTKPCMDIQKYAVEEINKAGGSSAGRWSTWFSTERETLPSPLKRPGG